MPSAARRRAQRAAVALLCILIGIGLVFGAVRVHGESRHLDSPSSPTIFVSIASYRDPHCPATLASLREMAAAPGVVFVGLIDQRAPEDGASCVDVAGQRSVSFHRWLTSHVRAKVLPHTASRGPAAARYLASQLYRGEAFFMMIDAHSVFRPHWDVELRRDVRRAQTAHGKRVVLSYHPIPVASDGPLGPNRTAAPDGAMALLSGAEFHPDWGVPVVFSRSVHCSRRCHAPVLQPFTCGGLLFAPAALIDEVPFDPRLDYVFHGEEVLFSARLWARGWRSFRPCDSVVGHLYERSKEPSLWNEAKALPPDWKAQQAASYRHVQGLLHLKRYNSTEPLVPANTHGDRPRDAYEIGSDVHAVERFWDFAVVNTSGWSMDESAWVC